MSADLGGHGTSHVVLYGACHAWACKVAEAKPWRPDPRFQKSASGVHWDIPYALSQKAKEGIDACGAACKVYDIVVHPRTCREPDKDVRFQVARRPFFGRWKACFIMSDVRTGRGHYA